MTVQAAETKPSAREPNIMETQARSVYPMAANINPALIEWREIEDSPGNYIKVLFIDEENHRVDFLFRQDPNTGYAKHTHLCTVCTYTIAGEWGYLEGPERLFPGCYAYEKVGSTHTPYATEKGMTVFASFQGTGPVLLELLDEKDNVTGHIGLDFYKHYYDG